MSLQHFAHNESQKGNDCWSTIFPATVNLCTVRGSRNVEACPGAHIISLAVEPSTETTFIISHSWGHASKMACTLTRLCNTLDGLPSRGYWPSSFPKHRFVAAWCWRRRLCS